MRRQTMHKEGVFARLREKLFVDLIGLEDFGTFGELILLAHARPDIRINSVRTSYVVRRRGPFDIFAGSRSVFLRTDGAESETRQRRCKPQRPGHVIPV